jgi:hypothetical protein
MIGDTQRISNTAAAAYYIYGAPFEIVVASIFLYKSVFLFASFRTRSDMTVFLGGRHSQEW